MIVSFVSTNSADRPVHPPFDLGIRSLSAHLRKKGHLTRLIFLPYDLGLARENYPKRVVEELKELLKDSDLIGITSNSLCAVKAAKLIDGIKSLKIPIIWGGIHCTFLPDECLKYADMVCVGEGEESLAILISKMETGKNIYDTPGIWFRRKGKIIDNGLGVLLKDLDQYPPYDYSMENHFILDKGKIVQFEERHLKWIYLTMSSRGCVYKCSFCAIGSMSNLYQNQGSFFRKRSIPHFMDELIRAKRSFSTLRYVWIDDNIFFLRNKKELEEFASEYKKHIGIPFQINMTPTLTDTRVIRLLIDAGLIRIFVGVQTGSDRLNRTLYERKFTTHNVLKTAQLLEKYANTIGIHYQFLYDEEHELDEDILATISLILMLLRSFYITLFKLINIPGTKFFDYEKTKRKSSDIFSYSFSYYGAKKNLIREFKKLKHIRYLHFVLLLSVALRRHKVTRKFMETVITLLANKKIISFFNRYHFFVSFLYIALQLLKHILAFLYFISGESRDKPQEDLF